MFFCINNLIVYYIYVGFKFVIFLSFLHFAFTAAGTRILLNMDVYQYKMVTVQQVLPVSVVSRHM